MTTNTEHSRRNGLKRRNQCKAGKVVRLLAAALFTTSLLGAGMLARPAVAQTDPFATGPQQDFKFYFSVQGYHPDGWFSEPAAIALDERSGLIYVADTKDGVVDAFSLQGIPKFQYGASNGLKAPVGVAVDRNGNLYVSENAGGPIKIINSRGETSTLAIPEEKDSASAPADSKGAKDAKDAPVKDSSAKDASAKEPAKDASSPKDAPAKDAPDKDASAQDAPAKDASAKEADTDDTPDTTPADDTFPGRVLPRFGFVREAPKPGRMTFDRDGNLYVVDRANCQVIVFDRDRKFKFRFGKIGDKRGEFKLLQAVATDRQGRIYTADAMGVPVQVFDRKGNYLYGYGMRGRGIDGLSFPAGIFVDRFDQVWVVDKTQHCIKVFDRSGAYLRTFGSYGQGEGSLFYPIDAAEDSLGRVYVLEFGTRRMQVFTLGHPFEPFTP